MSTGTVVAIATLIVALLVGGCMAFPNGTFGMFGQPSLSLDLSAGSAPQVEEEITVIFDFSDRQAIEGWYPVNDNVMGGVSQGNIALSGEGTAVFSGDISFRNNGGFSTVQANFSPALDLSRYTGIALRVRGDGKQYGMYLRDSARNLAHQATFTTTANDWQDVQLPFTAFEPTYFGERVRGNPLNPTEIRSMSLLIEFKQEGVFALEIAYIGAY